MPLLLLFLLLPVLLEAQNQAPPPDEYLFLEERIPFPSPAPWDPWIDYHSIQRPPATDPITRSQDWIEAFRAMRRDEPTRGIYAIVDGQSIDNVVDIKAIGQGSLLQVTTESRGDIDTRVIQVEDLEKLEFRGSGKKKVRVNM